MKRQEALERIEKALDRYEYKNLTAKVIALIALSEVESFGMKPPSEVFNIGDEKSPPYSAYEWKI